MRISKLFASILFSVSFLVAPLKAFATSFQPILTSDRTLTERSDETDFDLTETVHHLDVNVTRPTFVSQKNPLLPSVLLGAYLQE